jgi:hypothetical protein
MYTRTGPSTPLIYDVIHLYLYTQLFHGVLQETDDIPKRMKTLRTACDSSRYRWGGGERINAMSQRAGIFLLFFFPRPTKCQRLCI